MPEDAGACQRIALLLDHDVVTLYVNDSIALTTRLCNGRVNHLAFYAAHGSIKIRNLRICTGPAIDEQG